MTRDGALRRRGLPSPLPLSHRERGRENSDVLRGVRETFLLKLLASVALAVLTLVSRPALAQDAGITDAADDGAKVWTSCMEHVPSEALRPKFADMFPPRGLAGHALPLRIRVEHGKGETVFPAGIRVQSGSETGRALNEAGFQIPAEDGGAGPQMSTRLEGDRSITDVTIFLVALPQKPGRSEMLLPPLPVAVARASGELVTLCTAPHRILIDDPTSNVPEAMPKPNPPPRPQRELWTLARDVTYGLLIGAAAAALLTWLILKWMRRPRPAPPPPPPRPAWELAFEELAAIRRAGLAASGQLPEHFDRVSDAVRRYLGLLYGFDGIESTTDEALQSLRAANPPEATMPEIVSLLQESDLVKFARLSPTPDDCDEVLKRAERIVRETMPLTSPSQGGAA
jgi:hypothetical protein